MCAPTKPIRVPFLARLQCCSDGHPRRLLFASKVLFNQEKVGERSRQTMVALVLALMLVLVLVLVLVRVQTLEWVPTSTLQVVVVVCL